MHSTQEVSELIGRVDYSSAHRFIIAYSLAMHFNVAYPSNEIKAKIATDNLSILSTEDRTKMDDVLALLKEYVAFSPEEMQEIRESASSIYRWRLCFVCGVDPRTLPIHGSNCGTMGLFTLQDKFISPQDQAGASAINATDMSFINGIHAVIDHVWYGGEHGSTE